MSRPILRRLRFQTIAVGLLSIVLFAVPALSQTEADPVEPDGWAYAMAHDLMSPFCPGRTLAECPSPQADELRLWILTQAAAGAPQEEIQEALYERFGDQILSAPRPEGWGLAAYVIPIVGFILGGGVVWLALRRLVGSTKNASPAVVPAGSEMTADRELERRIDEELGA
jgi:cytochrome c-type biogenesis protein CcmH/NrfF